MAAAAADFYREWRNGRNTAEIAEMFDVPEHEVDRRLAKKRDEIWWERRLTEHRAKAREMRAQREKPKLGFTGRDTVAGYPRGRS
jgi:hypothetical protein